MTMDARKQRVLQAIVALYGLEGEPVGSSVLANYFDMAVSSATLRNEMAALTKLGLLEQPHTSAGRVPSAKGYRYYLDNLLTDDQPLDRVTRARVDAVFASLDHAGTSGLKIRNANLLRHDNDGILVALRQCTEAGEHHTSSQNQSNNLLHKGILLLMFAISESFDNSRPPRE